MVKKLFALASVTALTGVFAAGASAGCSSTTTETTNTDAGDSGGKDAAKKDSTPDEDTGTGEENCPADLKFDEEAIKKELGGSDYKKPVGVNQGRCSQADLTKLEANFNDKSNTKFSDLGKGLEADCVACIFTKTTDANWSTIVLTEDEKGFVNFGACHAAVNDSADCGKNFQYDQFCANSACGECSASSEQGCIGKVWGTGGACKAVHDAIAPSCPNFTKSQKDCGNTAVQHVKVICGSATTDGGTG